MSILLDTCAVLWAVGAPKRLSPAARSALGDPDARALVSAISSAEIACGCQRGRISLDRHWKTWFRHFVQRNEWEVLPIDLEIVEEAYCLPEPFHADPADRIIVATARVRRLAVITGDRRILSYPHVETVW